MAMPDDELKAHADAHRSSCMCSPPVIRLKDVIINLMHARLKDATLIAAGAERRTSLSEEHAARQPLACLDPPDRVLSEKSVSQYMKNTPETIFYPCLGFLGPPLNRGPVGGTT